MTDKRRMILSVVKGERLWMVNVSGRKVGGLEAVGSCPNKSVAVDTAYALAEGNKPARVKIYTAAGRLQVNYPVD